MIALVESIQNLWTLGRQSRFLSDMSPKLVCAALMTVKNPIFLESVRVNEKDEINSNLIKNTVEDFKNQIKEYAIGERKGFFAKDTDEFMNTGDCFEKIKGWVKDTYSISL